MVVLWWLDDEPQVFDPDKGDVIVEDFEDGSLILNGCKIFVGLKRSTANDGVMLLIICALGF
jgi:hypothetical protein